MSNSTIQIIGTVGPVSGSRAVLDGMVSSGMNIMRCNMSHGTHEQHAEYIALIRSIAAARNVRIPIIIDLSGPRETTDDGHQFDKDKEILTAKDLSDLDFAIEQGVEYIAQSYVGTASDVLALKSHLADRDASLPVIAKIERAQAVHDIEAIVAVSDAVMVARGDLGLAEPIEEIPYIEKRIIGCANSAQKPVITATQMLFSMVEHSVPTRAEVTDVVFAVMCGTDAVMLSDETAKGKYPIESVSFMKLIAQRAAQEYHRVSFRL